MKIQQHIKIRLALIVCSQKNTRAYMEPIKEFEGTEDDVKPYHVNCQSSDEYFYERRNKKNST